MTSTGTKVIAFELGLIIAILTWIAYDGLPWSRPQAPAATSQIADQAVGMVAPVYQPVQRSEPVDYPADDLEGDQWQAQGGVDPGSGYNSGYDQGGVASARYVQPDGILFQPGGAPDSIGIYPEPVLWNDCYFPSYYDFGYGPVIVVSNSRSFARGHQAMRRNPNPRRMGAGRPQTRRLQARFAPRMQNRHVLPRTNALSYGQVARQRAANVSRAGRIAPGRAAPAQRSRVVQGRRTYPQR